MLNSMSERAIAGHEISIRPLALPAEHGGWGLVLEPVALALVVAPSWAGAAVGLAVVAAFLARHPLRLAAGDWTRRRRYPRTLVCEDLALAYGSVALIAITTAMLFATPAILLPFAVAAPLALMQFAYDARNRGRAMWPELAGVAAAGATASAIAIAGGKPLAVAATLWLFTLLRSVPSVVFIRSILGRESRLLAVTLHVAALAIAIAMRQPGATAAMLFLLVRAVTTPPHEPARRVGIRELVYGVVTIVLIGAGYRLS